ncbi:MAG: hypothetical protein KGN37_14430 [Burkholderiales bacterium]|nr:hypothetical protein [Burkholderiales bacterium]
MPESVHTKIQIAFEYIDMAVTLYMSRQNYFCSLHLAAAAEEIFGMHFEHEEDSSHGKAWRAYKALEVLDGRDEIKNDAAKKFINWPKNAVKHMQRVGGQLDDRELFIDPEKEAEWFIEHALKNIGRLRLPKSSALQKYESYKAQQIRQSRGEST